MWFGYNLCMMKNFKCVECSESHEANFYPNNKSRCKSCCIKRSIAVYAPKHRERQAAYYKKWYAKNGRKRADDYRDIIYLWQKEHLESVGVRVEVAEAIRKGLLTRPLRCTLCGKEGRINGHHEDYNIPYEVVWVCSSCHKKIHLGILT